MKPCHLVKQQCALMLVDDRSEYDCWVKEPYSNAISQLEEEWTCVRRGKEQNSE